MRIVVVGGAGFIGCNAARRFQIRGERVAVVDNLSRRGARANLEWLQSQGPLDFVQADVRRPKQIASALRRFPDAQAVLHLAAQVAVTTSVANPREDFEINALGTFNVLEAVRQHLPSALVIYSSTNKVYGGMEEVAIESAKGAAPDEREGRYRYRDYPLGISEQHLLDFHSPYGCSKGAAEQYVRDYARIYGMRTVVFRQSCIYGPRQFGIEDQGWVVWFAISGVVGKNVRIYGDGRQVRDLLHVDDLLDAYDLAIARREEMKGRIYNVGGGAPFTRSVLGLIHQIERMLGRPLVYEHCPWRPGDQPVYVSDIRKARAELAWEPKIDPETGLDRVIRWICANEELIRGELGELLVEKRGSAAG